MTTPASAGAVQMPEPAVGQAILDNGLQVAWEEDRRQPIVALEVRIKGGLRGEGRYLGTGITHGIEHMLFKGTPSRPTGTIEQEVRRYGGTINAFTSFDTTGISLFVESRYLREALELLTDILQHARFDAKEFEKERVVIISEIQMNLDDPDRRLSQLFWNRHFLEHPYRHPILGYQPLLERLTIKDLADFYAAQYQPQHVTLAAVGDLEGARFGALAKELLGGWPRGTTEPTQLLAPSEPPAASAKRIAIELPVQTAYVMLGFSSVRLSDPDLYALDVLASILGHGHSSRLYETVVRQRQLAHGIAAWNYTPSDPGVFAVQFRTDPEKIDPATRAILEILETIQRRGVTEAELAKAKRLVSADYLFGLQTVEAKAGDLASSFASTGDPVFTRHYVFGVDRVTREEVQAVARRYCDPGTMTIAIIRPKAAEAAPASRPDQPRAIQIEKTDLPNGTSVLMGVDRRLPIAAIVVAFRGGVRVETEPTQGLSNLVASLLTQGTSRRSASQIAEHVESLGGALEPFSGRDGFGLVLQLLAQDLPEGLRLMHELVTQSTFPEQELAIQRTLIAKQLQAQEDEIFDVGGRLLRRTLFGAHPYRFHPLGDQAVIGSLSRERCLEFVQRWLVPANMVVAVLGDVDRDALRHRLGQTFGALPARPSPWPDRLPPASLDGVREASQTMDKEQAVIMLGFLGTTHAASDRHALDVLTAALSGMSGRLFQSVREARGLSYALGAVHVPGWDPGYLMVYAATRPEERTRVLDVLDEELRRAAQQGFRDEEIDQAKRYLIGLHRLDIQHLVGLTKRVALDELYGLGYDAWTTYEARINSITAPMVNEAAKRYLTLDHRTQVVISPNGR